MVGWALMDLDLAVRPLIRDGNGAGSGRISPAFGSNRFGFGDDFSPTVFEFGPLKLIGFGFDPWIPNG